MPRMARRAFDRDVFYELEGPKNQDMNRAQGEGAHAGLRELLRFTSLRTSGISSFTTAQGYGFYGDSFQVLPESPASGNVTISAGMAAKRDDTDMPASVGGVLGLDENSVVKPIYLQNPIIVPTAPAPAAPDKRIDIIQLRVEREFYDTAPVRTLDTTISQVIYPNKQKTLSYALDGLAVEYVTTPNPGTKPLVYKIGTAAPIPVAPPTDPGYVKIAEITVDNTVSNPAGTIRTEHIGDWRPMAFLGGSATFNLRVQLPLAAGAPTILTSAIPPGLRVEVARSVAGPTITFNVYLLNNVRNAVCHAEPFAIGAPGAFSRAILGGDVNTTTQTGDVTILNGAAMAAPGNKVCLNHPMSHTFMLLSKWNGAFVDESADPVTYSISGVVS